MLVMNGNILYYPSLLHLSTPEAMIALQKISMIFSLAVSLFCGSRIFTTY